MKVLVVIEELTLVSEGCVGSVMGAARQICHSCRFGGVTDRRCRVLWRLDRLPLSTLRTPRVTPDHSCTPTDHVNPVYALV